jgi:hypothetical protein
MPDKDSHASGHGRHTTVSPERELASVGEWPLHVQPSQICDRFTSETATQRPSFRF